MILTASLRQILRTLLRVGKLAGGVEDCGNIELHIAHTWAPWLSPAIGRSVFDHVTCLPAGAAMHGQVVTGCMVRLTRQHARRFTIRILIVTKSQNRITDLYLITISYGQRLDNAASVHIYAVEALKRDKDVAVVFATE